VRGIGKGGASGKRDKVHYVVNGKGMVYSVEAVESYLIKKGKDVALEEPGALSLFSFSLSDKVRFHSPCHPLLRNTRLSLPFPYPPPPIPRPSPPPPPPPPPFAPPRAHLPLFQSFTSPRFPRLSALPSPRPHTDSSLSTHGDATMIPRSGDEWHKQQGVQHSRCFGFLWLPSAPDH
jgi:hypothetical protein